MTNEGIADLLAEGLLADTKRQQDWSQYVEYIIKDRSPKEVKSKYWSFTDIEGALSNLGEDGSKRTLNRLAIIYKLMLLTKPVNEFKIEDTLEYFQTMQKAHIKINRSREGFERKMQATQIKEVSAISQDRSGGGVFGRIRGLFGR